MIGIEIILAVTGLPEYVLESSSLNALNIVSRAGDTRIKISEVSTKPRRQDGILEIVVKNDSFCFPAARLPS